jgi:protein involved in polysaccharide export with SLBB domain
MKKLLCPLVVLFILLSTNITNAQQAGPPDNAVGPSVQEMQKVDPQTTQAIMNAIQRGDMQGAKKIYEGLQKSQAQQGAIASAQSVTVEPSRPSLFEQAMPGNLKQFGYDLFNKTVSSFAPSTMPVGPDYIIGPGDQFTLTLWGTTEGIYDLKVSKEGQITLPKVGVVSVAGVRFGELEQTLKRHLSRYYNNFNLSVAMGGLKTLSVYVVGEVSNPGKYSLSSLTTAYGALFAAGGPTKLGTLREIQVMRSGKIIKTIDLYDFLMKGDRNQDVKLQNEDTVFVPLIGHVAGVAGAVYRPAIYELKGQETISDVIGTAGGVLPTALGGTLQLTRYVDNQKKVVLDIKLVKSPSDVQNAPKEFGEKIQNMDVVTIRMVYDKVWETVSLQGDVRNPGDYQWRQDLRLREVIQQGQLLPTADLTKAEIIRLAENYQDREIIPVSLSSLLSGDESQNLLLQPKDLIRVYTVYRDAEKVTISGEVNIPGVYEIKRGERLSDVLMRSGGLTKEGYPYGAVFKRKSVKTIESKNLLLFITRMQTQMIAIAAANVATSVGVEETTSAKAELAINQSLLESLKTLQEQNDGRVAINITGKIEDWAGSKEDLILQDGDTLLIPKQPQEVLVIGEVHSPGAQIYAPEMTVQDYIERTGGITKNAEHSEMFVVQANGNAFGTDSPKVGNLGKATLKAGDSIFIPPKTEHYAAMRNTKDIIDIIFKAAVIFATIHLLF